MLTNSGMIVLFKCFSHKIYEKRFLAKTVQMSWLYPEPFDANETLKTFYSFSHEPGNTGSNRLKVFTVTSLCIFPTRFEEGINEGLI